MYSTCRTYSTYGMDGGYTTYKKINGCDTIGDPDACRTAQCFWEDGACEFSRRTVHVDNCESGYADCGAAEDGRDGNGMGVRVAWATAIAGLFVISLMVALYVYRRRKMHNTVVVQSEAVKGHAVVENKPTERNLDDVAEVGAPLPWEGNAMYAV